MVLIRADGNSLIGTGHVMRCLSIADAFKRKDIEVIFATADDSMKSIIEDRGFSCFVLNSDYRNLELDLKNIQFEELITRTDSIIVDSYYVSKLYFDKLRNLTKTDNSDETITKIIYLDDLAEAVYPVDYLINYNIYADRKKYESLYYSKEYETKFIVGPQYAPLRREFSEGRIVIKEQVKSILVMTGGADTQHTSLGLIKALKEYHSKLTDSIAETCFHFVIGAMSKDYEIILNEVIGINNIVIHKNVKNMATLMLNSDIAVSAAGSTLYELCACGVPTITYILADNQVKGERAFRESGAMISIGDIRMNDDYTEKIIDSLVDLAQDYEHRKEMSEKQISISDGRGADRIVELLGR